MPRPIRLQKNTKRQQRALRSKAIKKKFLGVFKGIPRTRAILASKAAQRESLSAALVDMRAKKYMVSMQKVKLVHDRAGQKDVLTNYERRVLQDAIRNSKLLAKAWESYLDITRPIIEATEISRIESEISNCYEKYHLIRRLLTEVYPKKR
ncbi:MAG: hypothetical protein Q7S21_01540 [archaeon]|nr:hypothetical protein [archaeon]